MENVGNESYNLKSRKTNLMSNKRFLRIASIIALALPLTLTSCATETSEHPENVTEEAKESGEDVNGSLVISETEETTEQGPLEIRESLEWEQRLDYTNERQAEIADITVELSEDTEEIRTKAQTLLDAMASGNAEAAVESILTEDWYTVMLSDLLIGQRNYTGETDSVTWRLTVLSDELGEHCTAIEYPLSDGRNFYLQITDSEIRLYVCASDKTGSFSSESLNLTDGNYAGYEGTLSAEHHPLGKLTINMGTADLAGGVMEAFRGRTSGAVTYEGDFSEDGKPSMDTPGNFTKDGKTAYASRKEGKNTYYLTIPTETLESTFTTEQFGITTIWD
jgi:hypothetical protein